MREQTKITDPLFAKILLDISARNTLFFTPKQLYYLLSKRLQSRSLNRAIFARFTILLGVFSFEPILSLILKLIGTLWGWIFALSTVPARLIGIIVDMIQPKGIESSSKNISPLLFMAVAIPLLYAITVCFVISIAIIMLVGLFARNNPLLFTLIMITSMAIRVLLEAELSISKKSDRQANYKSIKNLEFLAGALLSIGVTVAIVAKSLPIGVLAICLGLNAAWLSLRGKRAQKNIHIANSHLLIEQAEVDNWLNKWMSINTQITKLLPPPQTYSLPATTNPQVTAYSFDRVIVCDNPAIAQLLISNNFHFENNSAILTIDGYPQSIFDTTMEMLYRNPNLKVYAFHDCTPDGIKLARQLRESEAWFPNLAIPIIDVGILPRQIMDNLDVMTLQSQQSAQISRQLQPDIRANLNRAELAWLDAGCYLELESFSPQKLIHILRRAISESRELATIEYGSMITMDRDNFYTAENFG
jgi:hypothetical protein